VWNRYLGTRAYDNTCYVAACNHLLRKGSKIVGSGIGIWDYTTAKLMKKIVDTDETILYCDLNIAELKKIAIKSQKRFF
jgi:predicted amidohydrolase